MTAVDTHDLAVIARLAQTYADAKRKVDQLDFRYAPRQEAMAACLAMADARAALANARKRLVAS